jgi:hypothetical protein
MTQRPPDPAGATIPDVVLERFRLGELPREAAQPLEARLRQDPALAQRLALLALDDEDVRREHPPDRLARDVLQRLRDRATSRGARSRRAAWIVPAASAAMVLVLALTARHEGWFTPGTPPSADVAPAADEERPKGARDALVIYQNTQFGAELLEDGEVVTRGDLVRVGYRVEERGYGAIVSLDGRGVLTLHLPAEGTRAVPLETSGTVLLDRAFELDDAPRVERFFLVRSPEPFELGPVLDAVRRAAAGDAGEATNLRLPPRFTFTVFTLRKDSRP